MKNRADKFQDLIVWQKGQEFFILVVKDIKCFPKSRISYIVAKQLIRSSSSISANIAEGFCRHSPGEIKYHFTVARGSTGESQDWYLKCEKLKYLSQEIVETRVRFLNDILKMIDAFIYRLQEQKSTQSKQSKQLKK